MEGVVRAYVDSGRLRRVLLLECVSEGIQSLFLQFGWPYANRMIDTKRVCRLVVDEF